MVLQSMQRAMAPLQNYSLSSGNISNELQTYADEIERLYTALDALLPDRFLTTATDRGLSAYEKLFGPAQDTLSIAERRSRLRRRLSLCEGDFTPAGLQKALESFGLEYTISEFPALYRLNIIAQADYTEAEKAFISSEVAKIMPAHVEFQIAFNSLIWDRIDEKDKTFYQLDNDNLRWEEIDSLEQ